jgi:hypothetical protein
VAAGGSRVVVAEQGFDRQNLHWMNTFTGELSNALQCAALALMVHDDDILYFELMERGQTIDRYDSCPGYFEPNASPEQLAPTGGNAELLCRVFDAQARRSEVETILRKSRGSDDGDAYLFESRRHRDLCYALNIPTWAVHFGYHYLSNHYLSNHYLSKQPLPTGLSPDEVVQVGPA